MMLRDVVDADLMTLFEHQRDPEACAMAGFASRDQDAFLAHWRNNVLANPRSTARTVLLDGHVAGYVSSWEVEGDCFIAYWFGREYWGSGLARAAVREYLRAHEPRRPVYADVIPSNMRSIRLLERCGFRRLNDSLLTNGEIDELRFELADE